MYVVMKSNYYRLIKEREQLLGPKRNVASKS